MISLPSIKTPLNQHSLKALETWLEGLGAQRSHSDPCCWDWDMPQWSAQIKLASDNIRITWEKERSKHHCTFSYGLSREDIQAAFYQGP